MICLLCGNEKILIKAHIIPRKLYNPLKDGKDAPIIYPTTLTKRWKQSQSGIYDDKILCRECDGNLLGPWDNYAQALLLEPFEAKNYILQTGKRYFYKKEKIDYVKLKLFFMAVLWRASITNENFFFEVNVGSWESVLKDMILKADPGTANDFSVILAKYEGALANIMPNPERVRTEGINCYRFRAAGYVFLIKVDSRPFPQKLKLGILTPNQPLLIKISQYEQSTELKEILKIEHQIPQ